jgi:hypothetical protein
MGVPCVRTSRCRLRIPLLVSAFLAAAMFGFPAGAPADTYKLPALSGQPTFDPVMASGRHQITLSTSGEFTVRLTVSKGPATTSYSVPGFISKRRVQARLGSMGGIDLRFDPNGRTRRSKVPRCTGGKLTHRRGVWEGNLKFRGEKGYTSINRFRVPGEVVSRPSLTCQAPNPSPVPPGTTLLSANRGELSIGLYFSALKRRPTSRASFTALKMEVRQRKIAITRSATATGPAGSFTYNNQATRATVTPPGPFAGRGQFNSNARRKWTGSLRVSLLGAGTVDLTGRNISASLFSS